MSPANPLRPGRRSLASLALIALVAMILTALGGGTAGAANANANANANAATAATARTAFHPRPVVAGSGYLALGDSVSFGYREPTNLPTPEYPDASSFVGYPEDVATALGLKLANASCPGETSASMIAIHQLSNGCENSPSSAPGYRTLFPLHVKYTGTQLAYAVHYLTVHPDTRLVSLMIGANDAFLCQETTKDGCASELPGVEAQIEANVRTILIKLRQKAHYSGQIVILNYYSTDYASATDREASQVLNAAQDTAAAPFHVTIAGGYEAFLKASAQVGGDTCKAGLLTTLTTGGCGVHPSIAGQALLALTVAGVVKH